MVETITGTMRGIRRIGERREINLCKEYEEAGIPDAHIQAHIDIMIGTEADIKQRSPLPKINPNWPAPRSAEV